MSQKLKYMIPELSQQQDLNSVVPETKKQQQMPVENTESTRLGPPHTGQVGFAGAT